MYLKKTDRNTARISVKPITLIVSLALIICMLVGGVAAFLTDTAIPLKNIFTPSHITTTVDETLDGNTKSDVSIKNTGDTDAWIRAAIVVTWKNESGDVYGTAPAAGTDYTMTLDLSNGWERGDDGFYYWKSPVAPAGNTGILITSCTYTANAPEEYFLSVEIIGSGIQNRPANVFNSSWSSGGFEVSADGNTLEKI